MPRSVTIVTVSPSHAIARGCPSPKDPPILCHAPLTASRRRISSSPAIANATSRPAAHTWEKCSRVSEASSAADGCAGCQRNAVPEEPTANTLSPQRAIATRVPRAAVGTVPIPNSDARSMARAAGPEGPAVLRPDHAADHEAGLVPCAERGAREEVEHAASLPGSREADAAVGPVGGRREALSSGQRP